MIDLSLPHNIPYENVVIGSVLSEPEKAFEVAAILEANNFYDPVNQAIVSAMFKLIAENATIHPLTIAEQLRRNEDFLRIGGIEHLEKMKSLAVPDILTFLREVKDKYILREKARVNALMLQAIRADDVDVATKVTSFETELLNLSSLKSADNYAKADTLTDTVLRQSYENKMSGNKFTGLRTYIDGFDLMTNGLQKEDFCIFAARVSVGKTSAITTILQNNLLNDLEKTFLVFSLEVSKLNFIQKMISGLAKVSYHNIKSGLMGIEEWARVIHARNLLNKSNIFIDDTPSVTPVFVKAKTSLTLAREKRLDGVFLDYVQLMSAGVKTNSPQEEVKLASIGLKSCAKSLKVPLIAAAQLNREPEKKAVDRRPLLSHLKESGQLEQDADLITFIHREEVYDDSDEKKGAAEWIIAKQRNGAVGTIHTAFIKQHTRFENIFFK